jgi:glycerol-3-phosphate dehydrogenase
MADFDLVIVGGGINGCGIARDAAGRGLSVLLVEQGDLGGATSSASTKLIHGGLRYLEHYDFRLVRKALAEREKLLALAPHLVRPMRFVFPQVRGGRPAWMLRAGFWLYDHLGGRTILPKTRILDLADDPAGVPLRPGFHTGFEYSDCVVDDSRLVIANAIGAREKGAKIRPHTRLVAARREGGHWQVVLQAAGRRETVQARALVNAAGPWVGRAAEIIIRIPTRAKVRLAKGSHVVLPRLHAHDRAYLLQAYDGRLVFAIPYQERYTLIGTTDIDISGDPAEAAPSADEILYLCRAAGAYFESPVEPSKLVWSFCGVRPLVDDGSGDVEDVTRDFTIEVEGRYGEPPLVSVLGGKLTTYRRLAEAVLAKLKHRLIMQRPWTADEPLPGGDVGAQGIAGLIKEISARHAFLPDALVRRLAFAYGTRVWRILADAKSLGDLGPPIVGNLFQAELDYLRLEEWARTPEDVLWRRTKLGLAANRAEIATLEKAFASAPPAQAAAE